MASSDQLQSIQATLRTMQETLRSLEQKAALPVLTRLDSDDANDSPKAANKPRSLSSARLNLSATQVETIRAIFNMFDVNQTGTISTKELQSLHKQLGEPLTDDEATAAVSELDHEGTGSVNFNKFLVWWYHAHEHTKGSAYTQRFKLMHDKVTSGSLDLEKVVTKNLGDMFTLEYRMNFFRENGGQPHPISPWHDIPLNRIGSGEQGQVYNFVCEIPKWTRAKFECATGEQYNPIKQDTQHGALRYYKYGDIMFNYGFLPQTWEDPEFVPADTGCPGDNDPIDVVEFGAKQIGVGAVVGVKVLGVLGLIDDGETDWKVLAISMADPMAHLIHDVDDLEVHLPGAIKAIHDYFRDYKIASGKVNTYALGGRAMPRQYAVKVIEETHKHWKSLYLEKKRGVIGESTQQLDSRAVVAPSA